MNERYPHLKADDPEVYDLIQRQAKLESATLKMIASESYATIDVLEACGSIFTNKYCEGYPGARYYEGNEVTDALENLAIERGKALFGCEHMNVQPYSGSPANAAVYRALLNPGDKVMGVPVSDGGHLTHGWKVSFSGNDYAQIPYRPNQETGRLDMDEVREIALRERPKMIWAGMSAYPFKLDYAAFAEIAKEVDAYLVADIAHINALIVAGVHPDPVPYCDVVTSTAHKMLRGPRAGFIMSKTADRYREKYRPESKWNLAELIDRGVFPTMQGGPHMHAVAAMAQICRHGRVQAIWRTDCEKREGAVRRIGIARSSDRGGRDGNAPASARFPQGRIYGKGRRESARQVRNYRELQYGAGRHALAF